MKRVVLAAVLAVLFVLIWAQAGQFTEKASSSCVSFKYSYEVQSDVKITGSGFVTVQGSMFKMVGNGLALWCDGKVKWTVDASAKEVVIENVGSDDFVSNPALLVASFGKAFRVESQKDSWYEGQKVRAAVLTPLKETGVKSAILYFSQDVPVAAEVYPKDGARIVVTISGFVFSELRPKEDFTYDMESKQDWIVTDLR